MFTGRPSPGAGRKSWALRRSWSTLAAMVLAIFGLGPLELLVIGGLILVIMGPTLLPSAGRYLGQMMVGLRKGANELNNQLSDSSKSDEDDDETKDKKD